MSECKYCGKPAGVFRSAHGECRKKHDIAVGIIQRLVYDAIHHNRDAAETRAKAQEYARINHLTPGELRATIAAAWNQILEKFIADDILSEREMQTLRLSAQQFEINPQLLRDMGVDQKISEVKHKMEVTAQMAALAQYKSQTIHALRNGEIRTYPYSAPPLPFVFDSKQSLIWLFQNVPYDLEKTRRRTIRTSHGVSFHGRYAGTSSSHTVESTDIERQDVGLVALASKHLYFSGEEKSLRIPYAKIVSVHPYSDGIVITKEAVNAKRQIFRNLDGNFAGEIIHALGPKIA